MIKSICFDAAGTLLHPYPSVGAIYSEVMGDFGVAYEANRLNAEFAKAFGSVFKDSRILDVEERERDFWRRIVRTSIESMSEQPSDFDAMFDALWEEFARGARWRATEGARELIEELRDEGYQTALLTNWDRRVYSVLEEMDLARLFDHVFVSSEIGFEKPDSRIFRHAEKVLGHDPSEIVHIGDSLRHDVKGACAAGWRAIFLGESKDLLGMDARAAGAIEGIKRHLG